MKLKKINWYGFNHEVVANRFKDTEYVNTFCVLGEYYPVAVYRCLKPNRKKKHKDYLLLQIINDPDSLEYGAKDKRVLIVRGMDQAQMNEFRYRDALHCKRCDDVIYSIYRHHMHSCSCNSVAVDGGDDYLKISGDGYPDHAAVVTWDLLTDGIIPEPTNVPA
jgi:hypothetical protein